jgi:hypothetical protein
MKSEIRELMAKLGERPRLGTASPLTPALSPLRGEGDAEEARRVFEPRRRVATLCSRGGAALSAARRLPLSEGAGRAPSLLHGERAGVRGKTSARLSNFAIGSRIPKPERNPKPEDRMLEARVRFGFRSSGFFGISDFGAPICT